MSKDSFTKREMFELLKLETEDRAYIEKYLLCSDHRNVLPNHIFAEIDRLNIKDHMDYRFKILPTAIFQYIDYLEIVEARKAATTARTLSWLAIGVSVILTFLQIFYN
ncbi:MAG: hypothetical protein JNK44_06325 [Cyclobacteriaceae bacterium]|nr:hypothetical protein [Cyclobacteriaceae bacterium]